MSPSFSLLKTIPFQEATKSVSQNFGIFPLRSTHIVSFISLLWPNKEVRLHRAKH